MEFRAFLGLLLAALAGTAVAQPRDACMEAYNAEVTRIEREAKARQKDGSEAAKQRRAKAAESQMKAAAQRAKKCQESAKAEAAVAAPKPPTAAECNARANERLAEIERRHAGSPPGVGQAGRGEEEAKVRAELAECSRRAPR